MKIRFEKDGKALEVEAEHQNDCFSLFDRLSKQVFPEMVFFGR